MQTETVIAGGRNIRKTFGELEVLKGIDIDIYRGEIAAIVGPSGAGKTTLLQILGLLDRPDAGGRLVINGQDTSSMSGRRQAALRNRSLGFVFQAHQLLPEFTAIENVMIPAFIGGCSRKEAYREALRLLQYLGLDRRTDHKPHELSGGEKQRVAVARALINRPALILADEPSGSLDTTNKEELRALFFRLREEMNQTFLIVTHDTGLAADCDRTIRLLDGCILKSDSDA